MNFYVFQKFGLDSKFSDISFSFDCLNKNSYKNDDVKIKFKSEKTKTCITQISIKKIDKSNFPLNFHEKYYYAKLQGYIKSEQCNFEIYFDVYHNFFNFIDFSVLIFYIVLSFFLLGLIDHCTYEDKEDRLSSFTVFVYLFGDIMQICYFTKVLFWQKTIVSIIFLILIFTKFYFLTFDIIKKGQE